MKSKKRHHDSSEESEESDATVKSSSTSESDSDDSSISEPRHKKKKKRADSSESDSNSDQKRTKKRKHKKKKKKHSKKKRRSDSLDDISDDAISISEGEISSKKRRKHKHKHSKRAHSSVSGDERYENQGERRLLSVVKERRPSSVGSQPSRTYYQKEYHETAHTDTYTREQEIEKFYRGSSKEKRDYRDNYNYDRDRSDRYATHDDKYNRPRERYGQSAHFTSNQEYGGRQREYDNFKRPVRYEEQRREDNFKRDRDPQYEARGESRGTNKFNRYEQKPIKRPEYEERRDYRDRRPPAEPDRYPEKEYEKRDKYHEDRPTLEQSRDVRRDRPSRPEKPPVSLQYKERSRSKSEEDRSFKEKRREDRDEKVRDRFKEERDSRVRERFKEEDRRERPRRSADRERRPSNSRRPDKPESPKTRERKSRFDNGNDKEYNWGKADIKKEGDKNQVEKEKPNFGLSGKLTADANTVNGVVIKYTEPEDAKQPKRRWRFYPFKGDKALPILYIHRQSSFLIGRDKKVVDISLEHPSISKQHSALQYRATPFTRNDGTQGRRVRPYIIDLESANGTFVNNKKIEPRRYIELLERDVVKFGFSQREYVLLHENSKDDAQDDDQEPACPVATTDMIKLEKRAKEAADADGE